MKKWRVVSGEKNTSCSALVTSFSLSTTPQHHTAGLSHHPRPAVWAFFG